MNTAQVIEQFNTAFTTHNPDLLDPIVSDDCVMGAIDGTETVGAESLKFWRDLATDPKISFIVDHVTVADDRSVVRWRMQHEGGVLSGVNLHLVRNGQIIESLGYAKTA